MKIKLFIGNIAPLPSLPCFILLCQLLRRGAGASSGSGVIHSFFFQFVIFFTSAKSTKFTNNSCESPVDEPIEVDKIFF